MLDLVVQIVSYKTKKYLSDCIDSVINDLRGSDISYKILIFENGSRDNLADLEEKYKNKQVNFYYSDKNLGFGGGHNSLAKKFPQSKYLFALNPDTIVAEGATKTLFDFMNGHLEAGLCGPKIFEENFRSHKKVFWPKIFIIKDFFERFLKIKILKSINVLEFNPLQGAAWFFRRAAFNKIGGFDENLFLYFEEGDICNSLKTAGYKIFFVYDAVVNHIYKSRTISEEEFSKYFEESSRYFYKKWPKGDIK